MAGPPSSPLRRTYDSLQASRYAAAAAVVLFHLHVIGQADRSSIFRILDFGYLGVDFFFVLSGFVIVHSHWNDIGKPSALGLFFRKRLLRIYPPYLIMVTASLATGSVLPSGSHSTGWAHVLANLALWPSSRGNILLVAWSLQQELFFYMLFSVAILNRAAGCIALFLFVASAGIAGPAAQFPLSFLFSLHHLQFGMGMLGAYLARNGVLRHPARFFIFGLAAFVFIAVIDVLWLNGGFNRPLKGLLDVPAGLTSLLLILSMISLEASSWRNIPRLPVFMGDASYALYLVHVPLISIGCKLFRRSGLFQTHAGVRICVLFILANLAAVVFHVAVEKPIGSWLRNRIGASRSRSSAALMPRSL